MRETELLQNVSSEYFGYIFNNCFHQFRFLLKMSGLICVLCFILDI